MNKHNVLFSVYCCQRSVRRKPVSGGKFRHNSNFSALHLSESDVKSDVKAVSQPVDAEKETGIEILF